MALDASIPLQVRLPESTTPLQTIGALMQLRGQQGEIALRNAQLAQANANTADIQAQAQSRDRDLADQNTVQEAFKDQAVSARIHSGDFSDLESKVQPKTLDTVRTNHAAYMDKLLAQTKTQNELRAGALDEIANTVVGLKSLIGPDGKPDLARINAELPGAFQRLSANGVFRNAGIPDAKLGALTDVSQLDDFLASIGGAKAATDKVLAQQKTAAEGRNANAEADAAGAHAEQFRADAGKLAADAANARANLPKLEADAEVARLEAEFAKTHGGMKPADFEKARHDRADEATAAGELGLRTKTFNMTYGPNAINQGLVGVQPHLIVPATSAYTKAGEEYATAVHAQDAMNTLLDLAQKGNKAAGSNLPLVGVETVNALNGIKRINSAEIAQYGSAGSLLDEIKGKIGKLAVGKPIPQDVLDDIRELHTQLGAQAKDLYARKVQVVNGAYGSKFQPVEFSGSAGSAAGGALAPPAVGTVSQGYRFKGGDPAAPGSWEKVQP